MTDFRIILWFTWFVAGSWFRNATTLSTKQSRVPVRSTTAMPSPSESREPNYGEGGFGCAPGSEGAGVPGAIDGTAGGRSIARSIAR